MFLKKQLWQAIGIVCFGRPLSSWENQEKILDQNTQINEGRFQFKLLCFYLPDYCNIFVLILEYYLMFFLSQYLKNYLKNPLPLSW